MPKVRKNFTKAEKEEINKMAAIIRNSRYPNGYISPHVAATLLFQSGYKKLVTIEKDD